MEALRGLGGRGRRIPPGDFPIPWRALRPVLASGGGWESSMSVAVTVQPVLAAEASPAPRRAPWVGRLGARRTATLLLVVLVDVLAWGAVPGWNLAALFVLGSLALLVTGGSRPRPHAVTALYAFAMLQAAALALHP